MKNLPKSVLWSLINDLVGLGKYRWRSTLRALEILAATHDVSTAIINALPTICNNYAASVKSIKRNKGLHAVEYKLEVDGAQSMVTFCNEILKLIKPEHFVNEHEKMVLMYDELDDPDAKSLMSDFLYFTKLSKTDTERLFDDKEILPLDTFYIKRLKNYCSEQKVNSYAKYIAQLVGHWEIDKADNEILVYLVRIYIFKQDFPSTKSFIPIAMEKLQKALMEGSYFTMLRDVISEMIGFLDTESFLRYINLFSSVQRYTDLDEVRDWAKYIIYTLDTKRDEEVNEIVSFLVKQTEEVEKSEEKTEDKQKVAQESEHESENKQTNETNITDVSSPKEKTNKKKKKN